jgi:hypothetical protein
MDRAKPRIDPAVSVWRSINAGTAVESQNGQLRKSVEAKTTELERQLIVVTGLTRDVQKAQLRHDADTN